MRRFLLSLGMIALLAGALAGQSAEWKTYNNAEGNFSAQFPGDPTDSVNPTDSSMKSHVVQLQQLPVVYILVWSFIDKEQPADDTNYAVFKDGVFSKLPSCTTDSEKSASPSFRGYIGHQYLLTCEYPQGKVKMRGNLYWGKHYSFALMTAFPASIPEPAGVNTFMGSFAITDPAK